MNTYKLLSPIVAFLLITVLFAGCAVAQTVENSVPNGVLTGITTSPPSTGVNPADHASPSGSRTPYLVGGTSPTTLSATVNPSDVAPNGDFTITGQLNDSTGAGIANQVVRLDRWDGSVGQFVPTGLTATTDGSGRYTFTYSESAAGWYYYSPFYAGDTTYAAASARYVSVVVNATVLTATPSATEVFIGQSFSVSGKLTVKSGGTALQGQTVILERWNGTAWRSTGQSTTTDQAGGYTLSYSGPVGSSRYIAYYPGDADHASSSSSEFTVNVADNRQLTQLSITVSNSAPAVNQNIDFTGILQTTGASPQRLANSRVDLHFSPDNKAWQFVSNTTTNANGEYGFTGSVGVSGTCYFRAYYAGTSQLHETFSPVIKVVIARQLTQVSLSVNNANPTVGQSIRYTGTVLTKETSPLRIPNAKVDLHISKDNANWQLIYTTTANSLGEYGFEGGIGASGTYYLRAYYPGATQYREAFSPTVKVTVGTAPTRQLTRLSLSASSTTPTAGQSITLSGIYQTKTTTPTRISGAPVYLHLSKNGVNWSLASASPAATSNGVYGFTGALDQGTYYVRAYSPGTSQYREAFSQTVKITVGATTTRQLTQLSLVASTPSAQSVAFSGNLKTKTLSGTPLTNSPVYLHVSKDNVNWSLVSGTSSTTTNTNGAYSLAKSYAAGTYYFRTYYPGTSTYREAFSPTAKVVVP